MAARRQSALSRTCAQRNRLSIEVLEDRRLLSVVSSGPEFQVNTYTTLDQHNAVVASDADGDFVVVWWSDGQDGSGHGVYAQRYDTAGVPQGGEFQVNTYTTDEQRNASVAMDADGDFVVAWESLSQDGDGWGVYAQRYNAAGVTQGSEFQVNAYTTSNQGSPSVAMDADGDFVVAWQSSGQDGSARSIYAQRYDAAGVPQGSEFQVNTYTTGAQIDPSVAMDADGDFVVAWASSFQDGDGYGIYAQRYDGAGFAQGAEFQVNTHTTDGQQNPSVAMDADGDFVVSWDSGNPISGQDGSEQGIYAQRYDAAGMAQGSEFQVNTYTIDSQNNPSVAMDADGDFVVAWTSGIQDGDGSAGTYAQRYNAVGVALGGEFQVNTYTTGTQGRPSVAMDADGDFVVAWESNGQDGDSDGIYAQRFIDTTNEFQVNTYTTSDQEEPMVASDADGDFVVVWQSDGQDGGSFGIYGQRYDAGGNPQGAEFQVNTYTTNSQVFPSVAMDADGDFVVAWSGAGGPDIGGIYAQRYNAAGVALGVEFLVNTYTTSNQRKPSVAMDPFGNFVVAWESYGQDGDNDGVFAQRYNAVGVAQGAELQVNSYTTNNQRAASAAMDAGGNFVVAWESDGQDGDNFGVYAQRYDAAGNPQGGEFQVNTYTTDTQDDPSVALDADGDFVVAWESFGQDGSGLGVFAQRYDATGAAQGVEFQVNTFTANLQLDPTVALAANGDLVVAWQSDSQDGSFGGIYGQRYDAAGNPLGSEFQVNTYTTGDQEDPAVAVDADGDFVVAWESNGQDGSGYGVYAQRYSVFEEFQVNTYTPLDQENAVVASDADGDFVVVWQSDGQDGGSFGIYGQRYDASGNPQGGEFQVNTYTPGDQNNPAVARDADGGFVVAWQSLSQDGDQTGIFAQRYFAHGVANGPEFQVNTYTTGSQFDPSVAIDADGDFVVAWESFGQDGSSNGIYAQRYDAAGNPQDTEFQVNTYTTSTQGDPSVALAANGDFVVAWTSSGQDGDSGGVYAQRYDAAGVAQGSEFQVNTYITDRQRGSSVAMDADGDFVVAWESEFQDGSGYGIYAQRYDASGNPQGSEFQVNTYLTGAQRFPSVAMDSGGDFTVTWHSDGQDGDGYGVYAQRYNAAGAAQGSEFQVNTYTTDNQRLPSVAMDADGDFVVAWSSSDQDGDGYGVFAQRYTAFQEFAVNTYTTGSQLFPAVASDNDGNFVVAWHSAGQDGDNNGIYAQRYDAAGDAQDTEFQVNAYTTGSQAFPAVAMDADGDFVVAWSSYGQDGAGGGADYGIYAQRFDAAGTAQGSEFRVNTYTTSKQFAPSVAMDADGDFVVAWHSYGQDGSGYGVYAQAYDAAGTAQGSEFLVNTYTTSTQAGPAVATDADGDFVVAWLSYGQDGSSNGIFAQRYDAAGMAQGSEFAVNTFTGNQQDAPSVAMDAAGNFVVAWQSNGQDGDGNGIYAQRFGAAGAAQGGEFQVHTYTTSGQGLPSVAMDANGEFTVAWQSNGQDGDVYGVYAQRYNAGGVAQGSELAVNTYTTSSQASPSVAMDADGDFVVAWYSNGQDGDSNGIYARRYVGVPEFQVNTYTTLSQASPDVASDAGGNFVVVWFSSGQDGDSGGIFAQRYDADGVAQGAEFQVNTYTTGNQNGPSVAMDADGDFVIAWGSAQDGSSYGIYAQRYDAAGVAQGGEFQVNTYTTSVQIFPDVAMDADGDFIVAWNSYGQDGSGYGVYAQRYDAAGNPQGGELQVNTFTTDAQKDPSVGMDSDGDFVVAWQSDGQDGSSDGVFAQRYNGAGDPQGVEFQVNTYTTFSQADPAVAMDADGDFVVAWESLQDGSSHGIYAQRYNAAGVAQLGEFAVNTYTTSNQRAPAIALDGDGDFVVAWESVGQDGDSEGIFAQRYNAAGDPLEAEFQVNTIATDAQESPAVAMDADGDFVVAWESYGQDGSGDGIYARRYFFPAPPATVVGRHLFYNESKYDGNSPGIVPPTGGANNDDTDAIATDKSAYLPGGGLITPASVSAYSRGINGIMVDISGAHGTLTLADFEFAMSEQGALVNNTPSTWVAAPAPTGFTVLADTPAVGTDRIEFIWANNAIENRYLEVTVEGLDASGGFNSNTGLLQTDFFYFGNRVGDDFLATPPVTFNTTAGDEIDARNNPGFLQPLTNIYDYNKDSLVSAADQIIARNAAGFQFKIDISNPPAAPAAPSSGAVDDGAGGSAVASAMTIPTLAEQRDSRSSITSRPSSSEPRDDPSSSPFLHLGEADNPRTKALAAAVDDVLGALVLDDELLESLLPAVADWG